MLLHCNGRTLDLSYPQVMGILNITPDSFSDGGVFFSTSLAVARARQMVEEGATLIDIGGESTRPGAQPVSVQEELDRVIPIIAAVARELPVVVSVDTAKPEVMRAAVAAGAGLINDVYALRNPGALEAAAACGVPVCLMHLRGAPRTMAWSAVAEQTTSHYASVVTEVREFLLQRVAACVAAGIARERLLLDPGFGFGKTLADNLSLFQQLTALFAVDLPWVVGVSRKSMIGAVLERPVEERLYGGVALAALAAWQGAAIIRTHDVRPTVEAIKMIAAVRGQRL